jgi:DNA-binding transcriptional ArsR family regulator
MSKVVLDRETFKALASDTRLDILKALDGRQLSLTDLMRATNMNKATLHEHLSRLTEVGLVKRLSREGHKWVYYRLTWKGESLLHPENTRIVVFFTISFISLCAGIIQILSYAKGTVTSMKYSVVDHALLSSPSYNILDVTIPHEKSLPRIISIIDRIPQLKELFYRYMERIYTLKVHHFTGEDLRLVLDNNTTQVIYHDPLNLYIGLSCIIVFLIMLFLSIWRLWDNKAIKI